MGLAIKNNIMASNAARHLGKSFGALASSVERLSSGLRINSAKDDAAGLAVRELMRADIAVLKQGSRNASDGISMLQTMEGATAVMDENLIRMKELAEQAATGSYSTDQRAIMNSEFAEMADEIERIANSTAFNGISMLNTDSGSVNIHVGTTETIDIDKVNMTKEGLNIKTGVEVNEATFEGSNDESSTGAYFVVANGTMDLDIQFSNSVATTSEASLSVSLTVGSYTIDQVVSEINATSSALGFAGDGTDISYDAASVVTNTDGSYSLKVASRDESDAVSMVLVGATANTLDIDTGGTTAAATGAGAALSDGVAGTDEFVSAQAEGGLNILTEEDAISALDIVGSAIKTKDEARAAFGYKMNRLESTQSVLNIQSENLMTAESRISDVDVASEMAVMTRNQVLSQAGVAMLSQANTMPQMALSLLR